MAGRLRGAVHSQRSPLPLSAFVREAGPSVPALEGRKRQAGSERHPAAVEVQTR